MSGYKTFFLPFLFSVNNISYIYPFKLAGPRVPINTYKETSLCLKQDIKHATKEQHKVTDRKLNPTPHEHHMNKCRPNYS